MPARINNIFKVLILITAVAFSFGLAPSSLTAEQIILKSEQHISAGQVTADLKVDVKRSSWSKSMEIKTWALGTDLAMAYIKSPEKDKGTVFLKTEDAVYNYLPKINKVIKMPMNLLAQKWMGTDMSTDDLVKGTTFSKDYNATLLGSETVNTRNSYKLKLLPKADADVLWGRIDLWIDKATYNQMKMKFYDEDLELVHTITGKNIKKMGGIDVVSQYTIVPANKKEQTTTLTYQSLDIKTKLSADFFTKENMKKVRP